MADDRRDDASADPSEFELVLEPSSDRYGAEDERWRSQVSDLYVSARQELDGLRRESTPVAGTKGAADAVILALGSAGAFETALGFFRAWLSRDRSRSLTVSWQAGDQRQRVTVKGDDINQPALQALTQAAVARLPGMTWPSPATKPS